MTRTLIKILASLMPIFVSAPIEAVSYQSLASISSTATEFVASQYSEKNNQVKIIPNKLDSRLRLVECSKALDADYASSSRNGSRLIVNIQCNGTKPWNLYVPVQVKILQEVVVLSHSLPRNSLITQKDLRLEKRDINRIRSGYFTQMDEVLGKNLKRSIAGGIALSPFYVESQLLVKRGQKVTLWAETSGITVKMAGKAMANGSAGERIKVKNLSSNRVIEGLITDDGLIRTQL